MHATAPHARPSIGAPGSLARIRPRQVTVTLRRTGATLCALLALAAMPVAMAGVPAPATDGAGAVDVTIPDFAPTGLTLGSCCYLNSVVTADLNADGLNDIVTGNGLGYDFTVRLGTGPGSFAAGVSYPVGAAELSHVAVAVGDLDRDGHIDVVAAGTTADGLWLYRGDGLGAFDAPRALSLGSGTFPQAVAVADVDGDARPDIVVANGESSNVSVLLGDGAGGFAPAVNFGIPVNPRAMAVGDVDGDGHADIVTTSGDLGALGVLAGNGSGSFSAPLVLPVGRNASPFGVAIADIDGDGHVDLVSANASGDGTPYPPLELPGSVSLLRGDGKGGFRAPRVFALQDVTGRAHSVAVGDVTADGRADIAVSHPIDNSVTVLVGDGSGRFMTRLRRPTGMSPGPLALADVTADGRLDLVTGNGEGVSLLPGNGAGDVGFDGNFAAGASPYAVAAVDVNADGHTDALVANFGDNAVSVLLGDGKGGLVAFGSHAVGSSPTALATADLDSDGNLDAVVGNFGSGDVSVLLGDGMGGFAPAVMVSVGAPGFEGPYAVALGDANGDGHPDVATVNTSFEGESISVLLGNGTGSLGPATTYRVGKEPWLTPQGLLLADVTGDARADIVTANLGGSNLSLLVGDGTGGFADALPLAAGEGPVMVRAADVNGDGHTDLVSLDHSGQSVSVIAGDGNGRFASPHTWPIAPPEEQALFRPFAWGLAVADVNGDGAEDIVTANTQTDTVSVLANDGTGAFPAFRIFGTGARPGAVDVADIDGDGRPDLLTANRENGNVSVLFARGGSGIADLAVATDAIPDNVGPGQEMSFETVLGNLGPDAAAFPGIGFALDAALPDLEVATLPGWSCDAAEVVDGTTSIACAAEALPAGGTAAFVATATAPASATGTTITLTTVATSDTSDPVPADNSDSAAVTVQGAVDMAVAVDGPAVFVRGTVASYSIDVANLGPSPAAQATLDVGIGVPASSVAMTPPAGWTCVQRPGTSTYAATCTRATAKPAGETSFVAAVTIGSRLFPPRFQVSARVSAAAEDPEPSNNAATLSSRLGRTP